MKTITFPCLTARMVPAAQVVANDYNPNKVATPEMELLRQSIEADGVTQPVVTFYDAEADLYIVVDGFHRYTILTKLLHCPEIPVVVIDKPIQDRLASSIRHHRARGKPQVDLVSVMVEKLLRLGWTDAEIAKHLGMEAEEVLRLKQMTGLAELFATQEFSRAWVRTPEEAQLYSPLTKEDAPHE